MQSIVVVRIVAFYLFVAAGAGSAFAQTAPATEITVEWDKTILVSKSTPTLQVVTNPMLAAGSPIHDGSFAALKELGADYVRYVPWLPYPKTAVAELEPPTKDQTSWDFTYIDPMTKDFLAATEGHSAIMNFSTIPAWMFKTDKPVQYPADPNQVFWHYTQGSELRDPSGTELGDYFGRLVSWYTRGGFTDENGKQHNSGYHYSFPIWEVLNEIDHEHKPTPELYTLEYDAIVESIRKASPETQFVGLALASAEVDPRYYEYFLNSKNHKAGIPLDYISYHFYAHPTLEQGLNEWQYTFFDQADRFLASARFIEAIKHRLSPNTKTDVNELGVILPTDRLEIQASKALPDKIPHRYWNAAGALYAYLFIGLAKEGVEVIGESQLVGYPSQYPSVSMMNYNTGKPNARYWVLSLLKDNFHPGDKLATTSSSDRGAGIEGQAFLTPLGKKLLMVNKRNREIEVTLPHGFEHASVATVDEDSADDHPRRGISDGPLIKLLPFSVAVLAVK
jgi:hypothetical protein